jgi:hypothetical protein
MPLGDKKTHPQQNGPVLIAKIMGGDMRLLIGCMLLLLALKSVDAATYTTQITSIDRGRSDEIPMILLSNGRVARLSKEDTLLLEDLDVALQQKSWIKVILNKERTILAVESVEAPQTHDSSFTSEEKSILYAPSVIPGLEQARMVFKQMNRNYNSDSQCYNRAHVWAWEMYQKYRINSQKVFMFFTPKYIRRYNFEWWFHVSPFVLVQDKGAVVERTMDFRYTNGPKTMKQWTDTFMSNDPECKVVSKYTEYEYTRENEDAGWCMMLKVPMYYYQPLDLEAMDKQGKVRLFWEEWEVSNAYREAFNYRRGN